LWKDLLTGLLVIGVFGCSTEQDGRIEASGTIESTDVNVAAKVGGLLLAVRPEEGKTVDSAAVVALIDHADLDWQLKQAEAGRALAQANLELAVNGPRAEDIAPAEAAVQQAAVQRDAAQTDLARVEKLAASGTATPKQLDDATTRLKTAEAALAQAEASLARLQAGTRPEQIAAGRARLAQAEAQVGAIQQRITDCAVRAPFGGVVTHRLMEPGEMAAPGSAILTLSQLDPVKLKVYLTEVEVGTIRLGQSVEVYLDAQPETPRLGRVRYISPTAEFTPKNIQTKEDRVKLVFAVEIELDNADGLLKPGLPADAVFETGEEPGDGRGD